MRPCLNQLAVRIFFFGVIALSAAFISLTPAHGAERLAKDVCVPFGSAVSFKPDAVPREVIDQVVSFAFSPVPRNDDIRESACVVMDQALLTQLADSVGLREFLSIRYARPLSEEEKAAGIAESQRDARARLLAPAVVAVFASNPRPDFDLGAIRGGIVLGRISAGARMTGLDAAIIPSGPGGLTQELFLSVVKMGGEGDLIGLVRIGTAAELAPLPKYPPFIGYR
jgi:hypothetical protein